MVTSPSWTLALGLLCLGPLMAHEPIPPRDDAHKPMIQWRISVGVLATASTLDMVSSRGGYELNPILGRGEFGTRQVATKSILIAAPVLLEWLVLRNHRDKAKYFTWANYIGAGTTMIGPVHNWR